MANNIFSSPGLYTQETDLSYLPLATPKVGACFIGLTKTGPAFTPVQVNSWGDYVTAFGGTDPDYYMSYAVKEYIRYASPAGIIRVLGLDTSSVSVSGSTPVGIIGVVSLKPEYSIIPDNNAFPAIRYAYTSAFVTALSAFANSGIATETSGSSSILDQGNGRNPNSHGFDLIASGTHTLAAYPYDNFTPQGLLFNSASAISSAYLYTGSSGFLIPLAFNVGLMFMFGFNCVNIPNGGFNSIKNNPVNTGSFILTNIYSPKHADLPGFRSSSLLELKIIHSGSDINNATCSLTTFDAHKSVGGPGNSTAINLQFPLVGGVTGSHKVAAFIKFQDMAGSAASASIYWDTGSNASSSTGTTTTPLAGNTNIITCYNISSNRYDYYMGDTVDKLTHTSGNQNFAGLFSGTFSETRMYYLDGDTYNTWDTIRTKVQLEFDKWQYTTTAIVLNSSTGSLVGEIISTERASIAGTSTNFNLTIGDDSYPSLSVNPDASRYMGKVLNTNPLANYNYYLKGAYGYSYSASMPMDLRFNTNTVIFGKYNSGNLSKYSNGQTTWLRSQGFSGVTYDLFKIHNLSDGNASNTNIKISIANIQPSTNTDVTKYGKFDILVRKFNDTDVSMIVLEQFTNLNFDPNSDQYIAKIIGDMYRVWNTDLNRYYDYGNYTSKSKYIRIEMTTDLDNVPQEALPVGFVAYEIPSFVDATSITIAASALPTVSSVVNVNDYYGIDFETYDIGDALQVCTTGSLLSSYATYSIENLTSCSLATASLTKWRKFTIPMHKGWDALDEGATNTYTGNTTVNNAVLEAIDLAGNKEEIDFTDLFIPGLTDSSIVDGAINMIEDRLDAFIVPDALERGSQIVDAQNVADLYNTTYAAFYYPWFQIYDKTNKRYVWVPPSVGAAGVIAYNDSVGYPWFAPAGNNRGVIFSSRRTEKRLYKDDRDDLYERGINPIVWDSDNSVTVWGQKTLAKRPSALDRINVRRLLIHIKKFVDGVAQGMLFENNGPRLWGQFINTVTPFLEAIKLRQGLYALRVVMDETINTPDIIDRNILKGQIYIQPTKTIEFLSIDFVLEPTGITFNE